MASARPELLHSRGGDIVQAGPRDVEAGIADPHDRKCEQAGALEGRSAVLVHWVTSLQGGRGREAECLGRCEQAGVFSS